MSILSYLIVGSGYRSEYYARIAKAHPDLFRAMYYCRSEEKAADLRARTGLPASTSLEECEAFGADFVVVAVNLENAAAACETWTGRGYAVLCETPVGATLPELCRLWELHTQGARIMVSEQYHRYPILAAGLRAVAEGKIGTPQSAYLSLAHDYHGASLLRRMLLVQGESFILHGERTENPVVESDSRYGAFTDGRVGQRVRKTVFATFSSGKRAIYDFSDVEYRTFLRSRHLMVRGDRGEWSDTILYTIDEDNVPTREHLMPKIPPRYRALDTQALRDVRKTWQPELFLDTAQDEFAVGSMLFDMADYLAGGPEVYSLREGLEDAYFWLLMEQAASQPWTEVRSEPMPWHA